jgi:hypothetical protein
MSGRDACVKLIKRPRDRTTVSPLLSEKASATAAAEYVVVRWLRAAVVSEVAVAGSGSLRQRQRRRRAAAACGGGVRLFSVTRDGMR